MQLMMIDSNPSLDFVCTECEHRITMTAMGHAIHGDPTCDQCGSEKFTVSVGGTGFFRSVGI